MTERERVLREVEKSERDLVRLTRELIQAKSVTGDEDRAQAVVREKLRGIGGRVDCWKPSPASSARLAPFAEEERRVGLRPNVVALFGPGGRGRSLAFNGHVDVVPEGESRLWKHPPFGAEVEGDRIYGRGSCDMKGGLAASIVAVESVVAVVRDLRSGLMVESVIGEESGGIGTLAAILRGHLPAAAVIAEPTDLALVTAHSGCLMFRLIVPGKAAHGASRYMGVSAIEKFEVVHGALLELERRRKAMKELPLFEGIPNPVTLSIGRLTAGDWDSTVPEAAVAEGRYGVWPGESLKSARLEFEEAVKSASARDPWLTKHPPRIHWFGPQWEPAETEAGHWLPRMVEGACRSALGRTPRRAAMTGGTDMRLFTNLAGIPAVLFGPGDDSIAHFRDEWVSIRDLVRACKVYALLALAWNEYIR